MSSQKQNPPEVETPINLPAGGSNEVGRLSDRLKRYNRAKERASQVIDEIPDHILSYAGQDYLRIAKAWDAMKDCGSWLLFRHYFTVGKFRLAKASFCKKSLLCPLCGLRRASKAAKSLSDKIIALKASQPTLKLSLMTLTIKNRPDLKECKDHITQALNRIAQRRRDHLKKTHKVESEFAKMQGGAFSFEIAKGSGSKQWHVHIHGVVMHEEDFDEKALSQEWAKVTGDSFIVDIRPFYNQENPILDLCEVTSYALKFSRLTTKELLEAYTLFSGSRLLRCYGLLYGLKIPSELTDDLYQDLPYIEHLFRYFEKKGFNLVHSENKNQRRHEFEDPNLRTLQNRNAKKHGDLLPSWQYDQDLISSINQAPF